MNATRQGVPGLAALCGTLLIASCQAPPMAAPSRAMAAPDRRDAADDGRHRHGTTTARTYAEPGAPPARFDAAPAARFEAAPAAQLDAAPAARLDAAPPAAVRLPSGERGIGFDDLGFATGLRKVLVPAGGAGRVDLLDPDSFTLAPLTVGTATPYRGGHGDGVTSADSDGRRIFATDRTSLRLLTIDPGKGAISEMAPLSGPPDYVRWVGATKEVWVTEPDQERIEIFSASQGGTLQTSGNIRVSGGPESLVIDDAGQRAFTHLWDGYTLAIDVGRRSVLAKWPNHCRASRGIAYDGDSGVVLAACAEGKLVALDANHDGRVLGSVLTGGGVDVIAWNPTLRHAYVPAASAGNMTVAAVSTTGEVQTLQVIPTVVGAHCVASDDRAHAWVCDPAHGQVLLFADTLR